MSAPSPLPDFGFQPHPEPHHDPVHHDPAGALAIELQRDIHHVGVDALRRSLPPPNEDSPESWARRDRSRHRSPSRVSLVPVNPAETTLAAHHVATLELASAARQEAVQLQLADPKRAAQCRAQAASMGREARGFLGKLLQAQAARTKREANPVTCESAAWSEHRTFNLLTEALESLPPAPVPAPAPPPPPAAETPPPAAGTSPPPIASPKRTPDAVSPKPPPAAAKTSSTRGDAGPGHAGRAALAAQRTGPSTTSPTREKQQTKWRWKADHYAENYPQRTRLLRLHKGLPPGRRFRAAGARPCCTPSSPAPAGSWSKRTPSTPMPPDAGTRRTSRTAPQRDARARRTPGRVAPA